MGCGASSGNPPLSDTKMRLISEMPPQKRRDCEDTFSALDKDGNGPCSKPPPRPSGGRGAHPPVAHRLYHVGGFHLGEAVPGCARHGWRWRGHHGAQPPPPWPLLGRSWSVRFPALTGVLAVVERVPLRVLAAAGGRPGLVSNDQRAAQPARSDGRVRLLGPQQPLRPALTCAPSSPKTRSGFPARKLRGEQSRPRTRLCPHVSPSTEHGLRCLAGTAST